MSQDLFQDTLNISYLFLKAIWLCDVKWNWMMSNDVFFLKSMKNCSCQQKYHMKGFQAHNIWKQQHNSILMRDYSSKSDMWCRNYSHSKVENWETKKLTSARNFGYTLQTPPAQKFFEIPKKCVKLNFRPWKVNFELLTQNLRGIIFTPHSE